MRVGQRGAWPRDCTRGRGLVGGWCRCVALASLHRVIVQPLAAFKNADIQGNLWCIGARAGSWKATIGPTPRPRASGLSLDVRAASSADSLSEDAEQTPADVYYGRHHELAQAA